MALRMADFADMDIFYPVHANVHFADDISSVKNKYE